MFHNNRKDNNFYGAITQLMQLQGSLDNHQSIIINYCKSTYMFANFACHLFSDFASGSKLQTFLAANIFRYDVHHLVTTYLQFNIVSLFVSSQCMNNKMRSNKQQCLKTKFLVYLLASY